MAEPQKQQLGEGQDNPGQAAKQVANAAKKAGKETAKQTAKKGAEATVNATTAVVKAGAQTGKAAAEIASGTAAGGPWGAIISAAWSMRHTLFKILVCLCLALVFIIVLVVGIPAIIIDRVVDFVVEEIINPIVDAFNYVVDGIADIIGLGHDSSETKIGKMIQNGNYDYALSMAALVDNTEVAAGYDMAYIMAAYSTSVNQADVDQSDVEAKLSSVSSEMFPVTAVEREKEVVVPVTYFSYEPTTVTVVTNIIESTSADGKFKYQYETAEMTYYEQAAELTSDVAVEVDIYEQVTVLLPIYTGTEITGTMETTFYQFTETQTLSPSTETVKYLECTIHPFDNNAVHNAFGLDLNASYNGMESTYADVINSRTIATKQIFYASNQGDPVIPLTNAELTAFVDRQNCSETRKHLIKTGLSLVGKVPYFWGGKSAAGWNDEWNTPKLVTSAGSTTTGTILPFGLDCSGFSDWTYKTALGVSLDGGSWYQWEDSYTITEDELLPGDLGFLAKENGNGWSHVLVFAGYSEDGRRMWVHSTMGSGVILNSPDYEDTLYLRRVKDVDFGDDNTK